MQRVKKRDSQVESIFDFDASTFVRNWRGLRPIFVTFIYELLKPSGSVQPRKEGDTI